MAQPPRRQDHVSRMAGVQEDDGLRPQISIDKELRFHVSRVLIEALERQFPLDASPRTASSLDGAIMIATINAQQAGRQQVISFLRSALDNQKEE